MPAAAEQVAALLYKWQSEADNPTLDR